MYSQQCKKRQRVNRILKFCKDDWRSINDIAKHLKITDQGAGNITREMRSAGILRTKPQRRGARGYQSMVFSTSIAVNLNDKGPRITPGNLAAAKIIDAVYKWAFNHGKPFSGVSAFSWLMDQNHPNVRFMGATALSRGFLEDDRFLKAEGNLWILAPEG